MTTPSLSFIAAAPSSPSARPATRANMPTSLRLVDTAGLADDCDTWIESCLQCGTLDNCGDNFCADCDDLAA